jgi:CDGSH-type Zn-finger protein
MGESPALRGDIYSKFREEHLTKITVNKNGSLRVEGDFTICDAESSPFDLGGRTSISLCRCGHSGNKPFCDGTHRTVDFQSEVKARALPAPAPKPPAA